MDYLRCSLTSSLRFLPLLLLLICAHAHPSVVIAANAEEGAKPQAAAVYPGDEWATVTPAEAGMDAALLEKARDYALTSGGSGMITRGGKQVIAWGDQAQRYDLKSTTKSFGATALGVAIGDGKIKLTDRAIDHHPTLGVPPESNKETGWIQKITIGHLAMQTAGFEKPGGYGKLMFTPGSAWHYSDAGPNWLAECLTLIYRRDLNELMFERVFEPIGITPSDLTWRKNQYRPHEIEGIARREFGAGIHANVDAMARFGLLYLREGKWRDQRILPADFVKMASRPIPEVVKLKEHEDPNHPGASDHYGLLWWNNGDGTLKNVPRDAYWTWGLYDSLVVVIPSLDVVVSRAAPVRGSWKRTEGAGHYDVLAPFLEPIVKACAADVKRAEADAKPASGGSPFPSSPVIAGIEWAPADSVVRLAKGGDNWPMTWADDDAQYTAYGDGWGFEPMVKKKLSMGFAKITGAPGNFVAVNVRSATGETIGQGPAGKKASGILCLGGVLYLWVRNADNSQLALSRDHGKTWEWLDWRFTESFGCPAFCQFGRDGGGSRDEFVYVYSFDSDSAYIPADRIVLARVPKQKIIEREAYEFFVKIGDNGKPVWSRDIRGRGGVLELPGRAYRLHVTYHPQLKRYLMTMPLVDALRAPGEVRFGGGRPDLRSKGGLAVLDAPEPWGPWTTAYWSEMWDIGPGESANFPTKWMSPEGRTLHLVFSGDDYFSVRRAELKLRDNQ